MGFRVVSVCVYSFFIFFVVFISFLGVLVFRRFGFGGVLLILGVSFIIRIRDFRVRMELVIFCFLREGEGYILDRSFGFLSVFWNFDFLELWNFFIFKFWKYWIMEF